MLGVNKLRKEFKERQVYVDKQIDDFIQLHVISSKRDKLYRELFGIYEQQIKQLQKEIDTFKARTPRPRPNLYCGNCDTYTPHTHSDMFGDILTRCVMCGTIYKVGQVRHDRR